MTSGSTSGWWRETPDAESSVLDDAELLHAAARGDDRAFAAVYEQHAPRVYALLRRLAADDDLAAEHLQATFVNAWRALASFRGASRVDTWLHRIAVNVHLAHLRARLRREVHELAVAELDTLAGITAGGRDDALRIDLDRAIASLPPAMRTAFVLHDVQGMPYDEIAAITNTAPATLRVQVSRARELLRRRLGDRA
jgi:RNA polymerase sigma factor (sigma-70 family)